jgi:hypothetical protein
MHTHDDNAAVSISQAAATATLAALMLAQTGMPWEGRDNWLRFFGTQYPNVPKTCLLVESVADIVKTDNGVTFTFILENAPHKIPVEGNLNDVILHGASPINILIPYTRNKMPSNQYIV